MLLLKNHLLFTWSLNLLSILYFCLVNLTTVAVLVFTYCPWWLSCSCSRVSRSNTDDTAQKPKIFVIWPFEKKRLADPWSKPTTQLNSLLPAVTYQAEHVTHETREEVYWVLPRKISLPMTGKSNSQKKSFHFVSLHSSFFPSNLGGWYIKMWWLEL